MAKLVLSVKEKRRLELLAKVKRGELTIAKASELLGISYRQGLRLYARYDRAGAAGLVHRLRGRKSNRESSAPRRKTILDRYRECYADFGPTLAAEYLGKENLGVSVQTLRRWLLEEGLWQVKRKHPQHRKWRARKECYGEMVQMDGSHHDWFEGRREWAVLMVMVDDATNETRARFFEAETTEAAMTMVCHYARSAGLPRAFYVDRAGIYSVNRDATIEESLAGDKALSQFGRAMKELDVELICAHSPQAKGRVERRNGILQDRLVKALRLRGISTLEAANQFLDEEYLAEFDGQFRVKAKCSTNVHRRVPRDLDLVLVLSIQEERVVGQDWTVQWRNRWFQLTEANRNLRLVKQKILVCEQLDGALRFRMGARELAWEELAERPKRGQKGQEKAGKASAGESGGSGRKGPWKPARDHPWRHGK